MMVTRLGSNEYYNNIIDSYQPDENAMYNNNRASSAAATLIQGEGRDTLAGEPVRRPAPRRAQYNYLSNVYTTIIIITTRRRSPV